MSLENPVLGETAEGLKACLLPWPSLSLKRLSPPVTMVSGKETVQSLASSAFRCNIQQLCRPRAGSCQDCRNSSAPGDALSQQGMEHQFMPMCLLV